MTDTPQIAAARIEVERRRARLMAVANELQTRLAPSTLARNTWQGAKDKGADLAEDAVDAVKARPLAATGVVAAITMFLAREPLMDLAGKLVGSGKSGKDKPRKTVKAKLVRGKPVKDEPQKDEAKAPTPAPEDKKTETA